MLLPAIGLSPLLAARAGQSFPPNRWLARLATPGNDLNILLAKAERPSGRKPATTGPAGNYWRRSTPTTAGWRTPRTPTAGRSGSSAVSTRAARRLCRGADRAGGRHRHQGCPRGAGAIAGAGRRKPAHALLLRWRWSRKASGTRRAAPSRRWRRIRRPTRPGCRWSTAISPRSGAMPPGSRRGGSVDPDNGARGGPTGKTWPRPTRWMRQGRQQMIEGMVDSTARG